MDVVEDMLLAEAVIACTLGAVPELHIGILCIRLPADAAFMVVAPLFLLGLYCFPELHRLGTRPGFDYIRLPMEFRREEDKEVQQCHQGNQRATPLTIN